MMQPKIKKKKERKNKENLRKSWSRGPRESGQLDVMSYPGGDPGKGSRTLRENAGNLNQVWIFVNNNFLLSKLWEMVKDREAGSAAVHGVAKSQTRLNDCTTVMTLEISAQPPLEGARNQRNQQASLRGGWERIERRLFAAFH